MSSFIRNLEHTLEQSAVPQEAQCGLLSLLLFTVSFNEFWGEVQVGEGVLKI